MIPEGIYQEGKCICCGKCCYFPNRKGKLIKCRFLLPNNTCRIYCNRIGKKGVLYINARCGYRKDSAWDYEGCPENTGKPILW